MLAFLLRVSDRVSRVKTRVCATIRVRVGMPIPEYGYRKNARTATDRKNMYGLTVLYTQPKGKTRLAPFTLG